MNKVKNLKYYILHITIIKKNIIKIIEIIEKLRNLININDIC